MRAKISLTIQIRNLGTKGTKYNISVYWDFVDLENNLLT